MTQNISSHANIKWKLYIKHRYNTSLTLLLIILELKHSNTRYIRHTITPDTSDILKQEKTMFSEYALKERQILPFLELLPEFPLQSYFKMYLGITEIEPQVGPLNCSLRMSQE